MATAAGRIGGAAGARERTLALLGALLGGVDVAVELWDGSRWPAAGASQAPFTLRLTHPGSLRRMFGRGGELALGEAYVRGDFEVEGDLEAAVALGQGLLARPMPLRERARLAAALLRLPAGPDRDPGRRAARLTGRIHSRERDAAAVRYHYDLPAAFYRLFLDSRLVYSCAYFESAEETLDAAQERKLDYVCRKLRLQPGDRLLDVGCGFGALVVHAAGRYGVDATGVTLSGTQAAEARAAIEARGLGHRCRVEVRDYRALEGVDAFDKVVSVGMFEHVGERELPRYFRHARRLLRPGGVFLNHGIARAANAPAPMRGRSFVARYVFPDGELVPVGTALAAAEEAGLEVRDVESLREHYALTLRHWVRRLEARRAEAEDVAGTGAYRTWRLYMAGSAHGFASGRLNVYQALLAKPDRGRSGLPLTRADWYRA